MKIIYFSPHPHINMAAPSGPGTHIREVILGFERSGHDVQRLIAGGEDLNLPANQIVYKKRPWKKFIPTILWESLKDYSLRKLDRQLEEQLVRMIEKHKPDFIYERAYYLMGAGYRAAKRTGVRYCCEINAPYPEEKKSMNGRSLFGSLAKKNEALQANSAHRIFVMSSALKTYLVKNTGVQENKVFVTPNAVNPDYAKNDQTFEKKLQQELGISGSEVVIGFVGSIFPYHGVDALIEAFAIITRKKITPVKLLIIGDGEILGQLRERVSELGIENQVIFTGNIPHRQIFSYIDLMQITVMARSNWYGSPVKIFEYGIKKKCIIAPDVVPVRDVMTDQIDGVLVKDNLEDLTTALEYVLRNPENSARMAATFYEKVISKHTWQQVSDNIIRAIQ